MRITHKKNENNTVETIINLKQNKTKQKFMQRQKF